MELKTDITILIIEGDEVDMMDFQRSIKKLNISNSVFCAANGVEGLMYLRGENGKPKIEQPCVILLDLHKAKMNGFEFLDVLRKDAELKDTTVFILTTSNIEKDKAKILAFWNRHHTKPLDDKYKWIYEGNPDGAAKTWMLRHEESDK